MTEQEKSTPSTISAALGETLGGARSKAAPLEPPTSQKTVAGIPAAKNLPGGSGKLPPNTGAAFIDNLPPPPTPPPRTANEKPRQSSGPVSAGHVKKDSRPPAHRPTDPPPRGLIVDEPRQPEKASAPAPLNLPAKSERPVINNLNLDPAIYNFDALILAKPKVETNGIVYLALNPKGETVGKVTITWRPK